jgi:hypothetical protein
MAGQPTSPLPNWVADELRARTAEQQPTVLDRYAAANQNCRNIAAEIGVDYEEHPRWRAAEREAEHLWKQARAAGHAVAEILAAGRPEGGHS